MKDEGGAIPAEWSKSNQFDRVVDRDLRMRDSLFDVSVYIIIILDDIVDSGIPETGRNRKSGHSK